MAKLFLDVLYYYRGSSSYFLHEFTLIPEHFHLLITVPARISVERAVQFVKGGFSFRARTELGFKGEIWQRGFSDHQIRDLQHFEACKEYVRLNAVKRRLVERPQVYPSCSAFPAFELDPAPQFQRLKPAGGRNEKRRIGTTKVVP